MPQLAPLRWGFLLGSADRPTPTTSAPTATMNHVLGVGCNRGSIEVGAVTDEGEVRIGLP